MLKNRKGCLFVISGPSGVGKGTLVSMLREKHPEFNLSISATTRKPRPGEIGGVHYFFLNKEEFQTMISTSQFLEWTEFAGNYYGTDKVIVENNLNDGYDLILEIDVKGALQVKSRLEDAILIFIEPPSVEELKKRLFKRKTESEKEIQERLAIVKSEIEKKDIFNYQVVNKDLDQAFANLEEIVLKEINKVETK